MSMQKKKSTVRDVIVIGFALFSMFFGAGNVVFPPYLGLEAGPEWMTGFATYFVADIGLALLGVFALLRVGSAAALDFMQQIARAILVPGITFWFGTALRARLNRPRPYEQPGFVPLLTKETKGHALSAAVLAMTWLRFFPAVGVAMVIITLLICALRVLVGVHSVPDVLFGAALGFGLGAVGMWLL